MSCLHRCAACTSIRVGQDLKLSCNRCASLASEVINRAYIQGVSVPGHDTQRRLPQDLLGPNS